MMRAYIAGRISSLSPFRKTEYTGILISAAIHCAVILLLYNMPDGKLIPHLQTIQISLEGQSGSSSDTPDRSEKPSTAKDNQPQNKTHQKTFLKPAPVKKQGVPEHRVNHRQEVIKTAVPTEKMNAAGRNEEVAGGTNAAVQNTAEAGESVMPMQETGGKIAETQFGEAGAPAFIHREMPVYPIMARRLGKEGKVILRLLIDKNGRLQGVEVIEHAGFGFTEAAIAAVKNSTFTPASRNGEKVMAKALLPVRFHLQ